MSSPPRRMFLASQKRSKRTSTVEDNGDTFNDRSCEEWEMLFVGIKDDDWMNLILVTFPEFIYR